MSIAAYVREGQHWILDQSDIICSTEHPRAVYEIISFWFVNVALIVSVLAWQSTTPHKAIAPSAIGSETLHCGTSRVPDGHWR